MLERQATSISLVSEPALGPRGGSPASVFPAPLETLLVPLDPLFKKSTLGIVCLTQAPVAGGIDLGRVLAQVPTSRDRT